MNFTAEFWAVEKKPVDPTDMNLWSLEFAKRVYKNSVRTTTGYTANMGDYSITMFDSGWNKLAHLIVMKSL